MTLVMPLTFQTCQSRYSLQEKSHLLWKVKNFEINGLNFRKK